MVMQLGNSFYSLLPFDKRTARSIEMSGRERGWSQFWATYVPKLGPREVLLFELSSTAYSTKLYYAISLIIS